MAVDKLIDSTLLNNNLTSVANAIRAKTGGNQQLSFPVGFINEINKFKTEYTFNENADVCFWDYDGTPLYSYSFDEIQSMEFLPPAPNHSQDNIPLTFQGWNWTLSELQGLTVPMDVGAIYYPTDDKIHWTYRLNTATGLTCSFTTSYTTDVIIDWGDGTVEHWGTGTENGANPTHTYLNPGTYHCSWDGSGRPSSAMRTEGNNAVVGTFYVGSKNNDNWLNQYWSGTFANSSIEYIVGFTREIPNSFYSMKYLRFFVATKTNVDFWGSSAAFKDCKNLKLVCFPNVQNLQTDNLLNGANIRRARLVPNTLLNRYSFAGAYSLEFYNGYCNIYRAINSCPALRRVVIKGTIGEDVFKDCPIEEVWCGLDEPPTMTSSNAFNAMPTSGIIHVKASSLNAYKEATDWSIYADHMVGDWTHDPIK